MFPKFKEIGIANQTLIIILFFMFFFWFYAAIEPFIYAQTGWGFLYDYNPDFHSNSDS